MNKGCAIRVALLFSVLLGVASGICAQDVLTLGEAVQLALRQNPALRSSEDESDAARARVQQARAAWFPQLDFSQDFTRGNNPVYVFGTLLTQRRFTAANFAVSSLNTPAPLDNFQTRLNGQVSLFDSGRTKFRVREAKRLETASDFETEQSRQDLIMRVVENYYSVIVAREDLLAANEAVRTAEVNEQRVEKMQETGLIVDSDLLSAKVFLAQAKDREIRAQNSLELSRMTLAREIGLGSDARPEPSVSLTEPPPIQGTRQEWMQTAVERRPALRAVQLREDATTDEKRASKADFGPKVGLYADVERDALTLGRSSGTNWTAGARLDFNLFAGGTQRSRFAEAQANENKAKHGLEWLRSGVLLEVQQSYLEATAAAQRAATARDSVEQAQEALRIIQNRYEAGLANLTELLRAQTAQIETRTGYLSAVHDWQVARAELERSAGVLTINSMLLQGTGAQ